jgi:aubergine-like protein
MEQPMLVIRINTKKQRAQEIYDVIKEKAPKVKFVFFFLNQRNTCYNNVKLCFNLNKLPSQFFVKFKPGMRGVMSIYAKLGIQMMAKMGKKIWAVDRGITSDKGTGTTLIGIDIERIANGQNFSAVATIDDTFTETYVKASFIELNTKKANREQIANVLSKLVPLLVKQYAKNNDDRLPVNVIIYRGGAGNSKGLLEDVSEEAEFIDKALEKLRQGKDVLRLAYISVSKRTPHRFFEINGGEKIYNPKGGLVIENRVTQRNHFNFFMVPQFVNQGCANSSEFYCVYNSTLLSADEFYQVTYNQTFNYFNWQGPVRIPAVLKYAEKQLEQYKVMVKVCKDKKSVANIMPSKKSFL